jgi:hypothetical protein
VPAERIIRLSALADRDVDAFGMIGARPLAIAEPVRAAADFDHAERSHDRIVEAFGGRDVRHRDGDMIKHHGAFSVPSLSSRP